ncbi:hypothetical protein DY000_02020459 [Brassica cretica]|uniref:Anaphase-promoting complex subunit 1 n=1 Tax=Brassica cretica TaxID=69181 RepID=A0ABQ7E498_BRACR|nr:hypothetical protein DY000_02020459 [Brassica cretica]
MILVIEVDSLTAFCLASSPNLQQPSTWVVVPLDHQKLYFKLQTKTQSIASWTLPDIQHFNWAFTLCVSAQYLCHPAQS